MSEPTMAELNAQRDMLAMAAMVGIIVATSKGQPYPGAAQTARLAYEYSDAMMAEAER